MKKISSFTIHADHPALAGHFPDMPIVPGVVLLDHALHALCCEAGLPVTHWQMSAVKFLSPLLPEQAATVQYETLSNGSVRLEVVSEGRPVLSASLTVSEA
jgi:3-hydroxyacyl-[acyl-carrier-protein] dehydratase